MNYDVYVEIQGAPQDRGEDVPQIANCIEFESNGDTKMCSRKPTISVKSVIQCIWIKKVKNRNDFHTYSRSRATTHTHTQTHDRAEMPGMI